MHRRILVATDLGEASDPAIRAGLDLGRRLGAHVVTLHVAEPSYRSRPWFVPFSSTELEMLEDLNLRAERAAKELLDKKVDELRGKGRDGPGVETTVRSGNAADTVVAAADDLGADLVVVGTHGRRFLKHVLLGSIAERILRTAPCPVMVVRAAKEPPPATAWQRIVCPVDFSETSRGAMEEAAELCQRLGGELTLLNVYQSPELALPEGVVLGGPGALEEVAASVDKKLAEWRSFAEARGCASVRTARVVGSPVPDILRVAEEKGADLIVMGTHGRTGFDHVLLGSVAERVIRRAPCAVLTVRHQR